MATERISIRDRGPGLLDIIVNDQRSGQVVKTEHGWQQTSLDGAPVGQPNPVKAYAILDTLERIKNA
ncbi:hypothetical protein SAMN05216577_1167 [Pseudomonas citronellolis]|uniref:Uncharacterized protein n=1 Tax=Pseudomonas citronellolis TaxID=53408 RepID=A0AAQ1HPG9_9PSED|nr:hypothetical protein [Pseudomonas citronellolis]TGC32390.1 hypothetical protein CW310_01840 [Pseudomonas citronellolis]SFD07243.1 hypothetical protein SAMN05216577_1167 [Pseudomonas citronellolis]